MSLRFEAWLIGVAPQEVIRRARRWRVYSPAALVRKKVGEGHETETSPDPFLNDTSAKRPLGGL